MPYYGMPVGTEHEEVGFGFNKSVITGLLRGRFGFEGIVCTDWGLINDSVLMGEPFPARAWGVEALTPLERIVKVLDAGVDQFGGENTPHQLIELVRDGKITEQRLDVSARRLLREKFVLGLFENAMMDASAAEDIVGAAEFVAAGEAAQRASITVLTNDVNSEGVPALPFARGLRIYAEGIDPEVVAEFGVVASSPGEADIAVLRLQAPFETRATFFENFFHAGSLDFDPDTLEHVREIAGQVPTIVDVFLDRPAILEPIVDAAAAVVVNWGVNARALLDVLTGGAKPKGRLPFDVPRSMSAVEQNLPDVPFDTVDPLFHFGHGLSL